MCEQYGKALRKTSSCCKALPRTCYFITRDASDDGEAFDESDLIELAQYEFGRVKDLREDKRRQAIADLQGRFKKSGDRVESDAITFCDGFRAKWFGKNFQHVQELVASMTNAEFAKDTTRSVPDDDR